MNQLAWVRLFDGRLWHMATDFQTWCGRDARVSDLSRPTEFLPDGPPANGWVCEKCVHAAHQAAELARQAWLQDPRHRTATGQLNLEEAND